MAKNEKLDLLKQHKAEYAASKAKPQMVAVGPARYLAVEGAGAPGGEAFQAKIGAIYSVAFTIKITRKAAGLGDYKVCPLEGLWWTEPDGSFSVARPRGQWRWRLLIRTPDFLAADDLAKAKESLRAKGKPADFEPVELASLDEGRCVQMLHVGPYETEHETIAKMLAFAAEQGLAVAGRHHEIYLSDPRRVPPERLRTILRLPVGPA